MAVAPVCRIIPSVTSTICHREVVSIVVDLIRPKAFAIAVSMNRRPGEFPSSSGADVQALQCVFEEFMENRKSRNVLRLVQDATLSIECA